MVTRFATSSSSSGGHPPLPPQPKRVYVCQDANFNVTSLLNDTGSVLQRFTYDPYGQSTPRSSSWSPTTDGYAWSWRHQGLMQDVESGLVYNRARYYQPGLGMFLVRDPIGYAGGINLFQYVAGKPCNRKDPSGLDAIADGLAGDPWAYSGPPPMPTITREERMQDRLKGLVGFCKQGMSECEAIAQYLERTADDNTTFNEFLLEIWADCRLISAEFQKRYKAETGREDKRDRNPACCHGFKPDLEYNAAENLKHFAGVLRWGKAGFIGVYQEDWRQWFDAKYLHPDVLSEREHEAEMKADLEGSAVNIHLDAIPLEDLFKDWPIKRHEIADQWRKRFCK